MGRAIVSAFTSGADLGDGRAAASARSPAPRASFPPGPSPTAAAAACSRNASLSLRACRSLRGLLGLWLLACGPNFGSARSVAEAFVDRYYVEADFVRALELCAGAAQDRLRREKGLADAARGGGAGPHPLAQSRVYRERAEMVEEGGERAALLFRLRIHPHEGAVFFRSVTVTLGRSGGRWSVVDMAEASAR